VLPVREVGVVEAEPPEKETGMIGWSADRLGEGGRTGPPGVVVTGAVLILALRLSFFL